MSSGGSLFKYFSKKRKTDEAAEIGDNTNANEIVLDDSSDANSIGNQQMVKSSTKSKTLQPARRFQESWKGTFSWIQVDATARETTVLCAVCKKFPHIHDAKSRFLTGYRAPFKLEAFKQHDASVTHTKCQEALKAQTSPASTPLAKSLRKISSEEFQHLTVLFNTAYFLAVHDKPLNDFQNQLELLEKVGTKLSSKYRNRTECTQFILHISKTLSQSLLESISRSPYGSVLVDGSTDTSNQSCAVVYIRFLNNGEVEEAFLSLQPLSNESGEGYFKCISSLLDELNVPFRKPGWLVGIGTDGAASMVGSKNGLCAHMKRIAPGVVSVHCVAHRLQLAVLDACSTVPFVRQCEDHFRSIFKFYNNSPKRSRELSETAAVLNEKMVKLKDLNAVRWVASKRRTVTALLTSWHSVVMHLENSACGVDGHKAQGLLKFMKRYRFVRFCHFLVDFLNIFHPVSEMFQREKILYSQVDVAIENGICKLEQLLKDPGIKELEFVSELSNGAFKGVQLDNEGNGMKLFAADRIKMVEGGLQFLRQRFQESHSVLKSLNVFDTMKWPEGRKIAEFGNEEIITLCKHFPETLVTAEDDRILDEWFELKSIGKQLDFNSLCTRCIEQPNRFPFLSKLMSIVACIPVSTATCERGFSALNRVKTCERSCLSFATTNSLLNIKMNGPNLREFDPSASIDLWLSEASQRRHVN